MKISIKKLDLLFVQAKGLFQHRFNLETVYYKSKESHVLGSYGDIYIPDENREFHYIGINTSLHNTELAIYETFLHELTHAWCYDMELNHMGHGYHFLKWANYFYRLGYNIYSQDCDMVQADAMLADTYNLTFTQLLEYAKLIDLTKDD